MGKKYVVVCAVHLGLGLALLSRTWMLSMSTTILLLAIPLSQLSIVSIWAALPARHLAVRCLTPVFGVAITWIFMSRIMPWGVGDAASVGWALAVSTQAATIFVAVACFGTRKHRGEPEEEVAQPRSSYQYNFGVATLLILTTASAIGVSLFRGAALYWEWTPELLKWELLPAMPVIGIANGLLAIVWYWAFCGQRERRVVSTFTAVAATCCLVLLTYGGTYATTGGSPLPLRDAFLSLIAQSVILATSLAAARTAFRKDASGGLGKAGFAQL